MATGLNMGMMVTCRRPTFGRMGKGFEQGSLPALLALPGAVETRVLPGDSMFQATHPDGLHETGHCAWLWGGQSS